MWKRASITLGLTAVGLAAVLGCAGRETRALAGEKPVAPGSGEVFFTEGFEDGRLLERGWYDAARPFKISPVNPRSGKGSVEYHWPTGASSADTASAVRRLFAPTESVYIRCYLRFSKGWGWTGRNYHPHMVNFLTTENPPYHGPAGSHLTLYVEPQEGRLRLAAQDIQNKDRPHGLTQGPIKGGYNGKFYDSPNVVFGEDRWHCVEAEFRLNTLDLARDRPNADGVARGWVDGKLVVDRTDVVLRSTDFPKMKFNQLLLAPYFGPGLLPHEQTLWIDDLTVGRRRSGAAG